MFGRRLKIERANVNDTGWYSCEGFNHFGHQSTTAYLLILPGMIHVVFLPLSLEIMQVFENYFSSEQFGGFGFEFEIFCLLRLTGLII